jgi:hypothetical protein
MAQFFALPGESTTKDSKKTFFINLDHVVRVVSRGKRGEPGPLEVVMTDGKSAKLVGDAARDFMDVVTSHHMIDLKHRSTSPRA